MADFKVSTEGDLVHVRVVSKMAASIEYPVGHVLLLVERRGSLIRGDTGDIGWTTDGFVVGPINGPGELKSPLTRDSISLEGYLRYQSSLELVEGGSPDGSDASDARMFRWLLSGNGYFMEEHGLCGFKPSIEEQNRARKFIYDAMMGRPHNGSA